jgi:hypothetical protein
MRRYFWMGLESGSISHGSWVVGHLGQHGKDSERWAAVSLTPCPISHSLKPVKFWLGLGGSSPVQKRICNFFLGSLKLSKTEQAQCVRDSGRS